MDTQEMQMIQAVAEAVIYGREVYLVYDGQGNKTALYKAVLDLQPTQEPKKVLASILI